MTWAQELAGAIADLPGFEVLTARVNDDGRVYLTKTRHAGRFVVRVQVGQFDCTREDVMAVAEVLRGLT